MSGKKSKTIDPANLDPDEKLKYEVAEEIGLLDKVMTEGWKSLTSIIHPRETTGDVYERKNKCFEYGNGLHNSEGSDVKSDCVSGKRVG